MIVIFWMKEKIEKNIWSIEYIIILLKMLIFMDYCEDGGRKISFNKKFERDII